ncbi:MAG: hypothetical protein L0312_18740, partial [Acidobacteria bacterium]|nr:hypothetical protein [Acidobacteriota bacterium]
SPFCWRKKPNTHSSSGKIGKSCIRERQACPIIPAMNKTTKILIGLGTALFFGYVIYSSMGLDQFRCEVCMEFRGQTACATAAGTTREEAQRTASDTACAQISSGVTDSIACSQSPPKSVTFK